MKCPTCGAPPGHPCVDDGQDDAHQGSGIHRARELAGVGGGIHDSVVGSIGTLWWAHQGNGPDRLAAKLHGHGCGYYWTDVMVDCRTGDEFEITTWADPPWYARRARVTDLPPAMRAAWPTGRNGKPVTPGLGDGGPGDQAPGETWLRRHAGAGPAEPDQLSLLG